MKKLFLIFALLFTSFCAMALTPTQNATLKAYIEADAVFSTMPHNEDSAYFIVDELYKDNDPAWVVWRTTTPISEVVDSIVWANYTPSTASAGAGTDATNWRLDCEGKQFNLQMLLTNPSGQISSGKENIRAGFDDALKNIPSGTNGATKNAGYAAVNTVFQRNANRAEKLLSTGTGTAASPANLVFEGKLAILDIMTAMGW